MSHYKLFAVSGELARPVMLGLFSGGCSTKGSPILGPFSRHAQQPSTRADWLAVQAVLHEPFSMANSC